MDAKEMLKRTKLFSYDCIDLCGSLGGNYLKNHVRGQLTYTYKTGTLFALEYM